MSKPFIEITSEEMDALLKRIQQALDEQLSLTAEDIRLILNILQHFAFMQEKLESDKVMKQKYLKLLGLVNNSETQEKLLDQGASSKKKLSGLGKNGRPPRRQSPRGFAITALSSLKKASAAPPATKANSISLNPPALCALSVHRP